MSPGKMARDTFGIGRRGRLKAGLLLVATCAVCVGAGRTPRSHGTVSRAYAEGRSLFLKVWEPGAPSPKGGDGLGPLYNGTSCVECHNLGGTGGGGGTESNVVILTAIGSPTHTERNESVFQGELEDLHPGFRNHTSVVLHRHATSPDDEKRLWKAKSYTKVQTRDELIALRTSTRNTPALFGAGLIDAIDDKTLLEAEKRQFPRFPEIKGRVSRLRDGRLGRFGWKGQTASLRDFVLAACSKELGLEVPGLHQLSLVSAKEFDPSRLKLDLDEDQCRLLVEFVSSLPAPVLQPKGDGFLASRGALVFESVGCATCHAPRLGKVEGLLSDLLLHDLGDRFSDSGAYYGGPAGQGRVVDLASGKERPPSSGEADPTEWRTPPLWGVADSPPYLHDGRANTLDEAIRLHGGEATATSKRYAQLAPGARQALLAFLHALTARTQPRLLANSAVKRHRVGRK